MLTAARSLPCILAVCQIIDAFSSSITFYCRSWFFGLGFVVAPCLLIAHQLAVWESIVWFKHLLLFRKGRGATHGWQGSSSRYQLPRSPACMCQIKEEHRRQPLPKAPWAGAETLWMVTERRGRGRGRGYQEAGVWVRVLGLTSRMLVDKGILSTRLNLQISYLAGPAL